MTKCFLSFLSNCFILKHIQCQNLEKIVQRLKSKQIFSYLPSAYENLLKKVDLTSLSIAYLNNSNNFLSDFSPLRYTYCYHLLYTPHSEMKALHRGVKRSFIYVILNFESKDLEPSK